MKSTIGFCAMTLAAAGLLLAPAVNAQTQTTPPTTKPDRAAPAADISEKKLDAAAKAVKNVSTIRDSYEQKLIKAPSDQKAKLADEASDAMAKAVKNVSTIRDSYEQKLIKAPADQKAKLADEASDAMAKAVKDQGLSVEEYTNIIEVAQNDPAVRNKLLQRLK